MFFELARSGVAAREGKRENFHKFPAGPVQELEKLCATLANVRLTDQIWEEANDKSYFKCRKLSDIVVRTPTPVRGLLNIGDSRDGGSNAK